MQYLLRFKVWCGSRSAIGKALLSLAIYIPGCVSGGWMHGIYITGLIGLISSSVTPTYVQQKGLVHFSGFSCHR